MDWRDWSFSITFFDWAARKVRSFSFSLGSDRARIWTAKMAAFFAPALPMAIEATGTPGGIWTVERRASMPLGPSAAARGTPMMGSWVRPASEPARWAAMPAAAIIIFIPFAAALSANWAAASGVRWALMILTMGVMPNSFS